MRQVLLRVITVVKISMKSHKDEQVLFHKMLHMPVTFHNASWKQMEVHSKTKERYYLIDKVCEDRQDFWPCGTKIHKKIFLLVFHAQHSEYDSCSQRSSHKTLKVILSDENWDIIKKPNRLNESKTNYVQHRGPFTWFILHFIPSTSTSYVASITSCGTHSQWTTDCP